MHSICCFTRNRRIFKFSHHFKTDVTSRISHREQSSFNYTISTNAIIITKAINVKVAIKKDN